MIPGSFKSTSVRTLFVTALLFSPVSFATESDDIAPPQPLTLQDMSGHGKFEVALPMAPSDGCFAMAPRLSVYGGTGTVAYGLVVPMAVVFPDGAGDTEFMLGNITADVKGRGCLGVGMANFCIGGGVAVGVGFLEADSPGKIAAASAGTSLSQDVVFHLPETTVVRPIVVANVNLLGFVAQAEVGTAILIPLRNTAGRDTEALITWGLGAGYHFADLLLPMIEIRGLHDLTGGIAFNATYVNLGVRVTLGPIEPVLRIGLPLNSTAKIFDTNDVQIELGVAFRF